MKYIILLADGMADRPVPELGGKTPLQAADTPNMDAVFRKSECGMVKTLVKGMPLGSDIGNLSVLGNNPAEHYTGRAPLEAVNMGIDAAPEEVIFRCNLVYVKNGIMEDYSAGHITDAEAKELIKLIDKKLGAGKYRFYPGKSYRHIMIMKGGEKIKAVPPHDISGKKIEEYMPQGAKSEELADLMKNSLFLLDYHEVNLARKSEGKNPGNMIWLWGQGKKSELPKLKEKYGLSGSVISAVDLINGIGLSMGMNVVKVPGVTGYIDTNYKGKAQAALKALKKDDFVYLHVEAADEMGHRADAKGKVLAVEKFDAEITGPVLEGLKKTGEPFRLMVTSDHATPIEARTHTDEPVPFFIYDSQNEKENNISGLSEAAISKESPLMFEKGWELFPYFLGR
ncbi:MAG: cofactor-independent phosphoglycerate mutase [Candidatus Goldiibacteriota bacterium]